MFSITKNNNGQSLVEIIVAIGIFAVGANAVISLVLSSYVTSSSGGAYTKAALTLQETTEAMTAVSKEAYNRLLPGTYGLDFSGGSWMLTGSPDVHDGFTRSVTISEVERDGGGSISTGVVDVQTRKITTSVDWQSRGQAKSVTSVFYLTNHTSTTLFEDVASDFSDGLFTNTEGSMAGDGDGAIALLFTPADEGPGSYATTGTYVSSVFDAGNAASWNTIQWSADTASCGSGMVQLQLRTAASESGLASELWQGPEGKDADETDYFTVSSGEMVDATHNGDRYIQYRATLTAGGTCSPLLTDLTITETPYE